MSSKFLIFAGARTGSVTLSHCVKHTIIEPGQDWSKVIIDEPFTQPLKLPEPWRQYIIDKCAGLNIDLEDGSRGKHVINRTSISQLYKLLDIIYCDHVGIKHIYNQNYMWFNHALLDYAAYNGIKIIHLHRDNIYDTILSGFMAQQEGIWSTHTDEKRQVVDNHIYKPIDLQLFCNRVRAEQKHYRGHVRYIALKNIDTMKIVYEEFLGSDMSLDERVSIFTKALNYIGYEYIDNIPAVLDVLHPKTKQHTDTHYDKIPNIKEIYDWVERQDYNK